MQTFLPYASFAQSARVLDRQRLGKQRLEVYTLLTILRGVARGRGWATHPAARMWAGHEEALADYGIAICKEWRRRGYKDTMLERITALRGDKRARKPSWFGDPAFHAAHRSNLLRKDPEWYGQFGWTEGPDLPYVWPKGGRASDDASV